MAALAGAVVGGGRGIQHQGRGIATVKGIDRWSGRRGGTNALVRGLEAQWVPRIQGGYRLAFGRPSMGSSARLTGLPIRVAPS